VPSTADKIMRTVRRHGRGRRVYAYSDFASLGTRAAVDRTLARLAAAGELRRVARGLYDFPRRSKLLDAAAPPSIEAVVEAIARRDGETIISNHLVAANGLGLTTAVPVRPMFLTSGRSRTIKLGNRTIELRHAPAKLLRCSAEPERLAAQAILWLGKDAALGAVPKLRESLTHRTVERLAETRARVPLWATRVIDRVLAEDDEWPSPSQSDPPV
jgi:hypothetical protein